MSKNEKGGREAEIRKLRIGKIERLKEIGMEAYPDPATTKPSITLKEISENFSKIESQKKEYKIVGRILVKRGAGKISFAKISDGTGEFQVVLQDDILGSEKMKVFDKLFDMGDFANFTGTLFKTQKGENSLLVSDFKMAGKTLLPMPEKFHGLQDIEEKYRKRYLDILSDKKTFERFKMRAKVISEIRRILDEEDFLEIETPILQNQASGAMAETFNTFHNDYGIDMVLRIACEAEHKMVMAGGYPAVYEFSKDFRNEGSDPTHIQEFTMLEWYKAYEGLEYNIDLTEKMLKSLAEKIVGKSKFKIESASGEVVEVDFSKK
jgi:lysyl-tRNA synthetase class 2